MFKMKIETKINVNINKRWWIKRKEAAEEKE